MIAVFSFKVYDEITAGIGLGFTSFKRLRCSFSYIGRSVVIWKRKLLANTDKFQCVSFSFLKM